MNEFKLGLILGSGIKIDKDRISDVKILSKNPKGIHKKIIYTCRINNAHIMIFQGRKHFYEGYSETELTENISYLYEAGVRTLLITNAAGGVNSNLNVADLMIIRSHINLNNSLNTGYLHFPYSKNIADRFLNACSGVKIKVHEGVYGYYQGPTYETRAEIRFQKRYNIDAVGMSTIPEVMMANKMGISVLAISVITNLLSENSREPVTHNSVLANADTASTSLNKALSAFIPQLN